MFFRLVEHYSEDNDLLDIKNLTQNNNSDSVHECFICFDVSIKEESIPIRLKNNNCYFMTCICDGSVHKYCLDLWYHSNNECPICRKTMIKNDVKTRFVRGYCFFTRISLQIIRTGVYCVFLICTIQMYISIFIVFFNLSYAVFY